MIAAFHIAKIFGPLLLIVGIWNLFNRKRAMDTAKKLSTNSGLMTLHAILNLIVGLTIVSFFNDWVFDLTLLVTLFGWFLIVRGVCALYLPSFVVNCQLSSATCLTVWGVLWIVWGFFLTWLGFFCKMGQSMY